MYFSTDNTQLQLFKKFKLEVTTNRSGLKLKQNIAIQKNLT